MDLHRGSEVRGYAFEWNNMPPERIPRCINLEQGNYDKLY